MRNQRYGRILNVSSSATLGIGTVAPYSSAKAAMIGLTCEAAIEGKPHGIGINAIFPAGYTRLAAKSQEAARAWMETSFRATARCASSRLFRQSRDDAHRRDLRSGRWARLTYRYVQQRWLLQPGAHAGVDARNTLKISATLEKVVHVGSSMEENMRYTKWLPWTGGRAGTF